MGFSSYPSRTSSTDLKSVRLASLAVVQLVRLATTSLRLSFKFIWWPKAPSDALIRHYVPFWLITARPNCTITTVGLYLWRGITTHLTRRPFPAITASLSSQSLWHGYPISFRLVTCRSLDNKLVRQPTITSPATATSIASDTLYLGGITTSLSLVNPQLRPTPSKPQQHLPQTHTHILPRQRANFTSCLRDRDQALGTVQRARPAPRNAINTSNRRR